jgi:hypothetical protein
LLAKVVASEQITLYYEFLLLALSSTQSTQVIAPLEQEFPQRQQHISKSPTYGGTNFHGRNLDVWGSPGVVTRKPFLGFDVNPT